MEFHRIPASAIAGIPIVFLTMTNIITAQDIRKLPWDTLMLVAGGLSLGLAINESGLSNVFIQQISHLNLEIVVLLFVFSGITILVSNFMSNTATAAIMVPLALSLGTFPIPLTMVIGLSCSVCLFMPISTPPNAIAYATGKLEQKDFRYLGIIAGVVGAFLIILWVFLLTTLIY